MSDTKHGRAFWVYILIAAAFVGWIGVKTQITANRQESEARTAVAFSEHTRYCLDKLLDTLAVRSEITENSERLNNDQHKALADLITAVSVAANRNETDFRAVFNRYLEPVVAAQKRQEELLQARSEHPLPAPDCPVVR
jgi:hypothetical protein